MSLFRFIQPDSSINHHSNELANAADRGKPSLGSVSPESFAKRKHIDRNRQHIAKFREAGIHRDFHSHRVQTRIVQPEHTEPMASNTTKPTPTQPTRGVMPRTTGGYREPGSRGFNPFR